MIGKLKLSSGDPTPKVWATASYDQASNTSEVFFHILTANGKKYNFKGTLIDELERI